VKYCGTVQFRQWVMSEENINMTVAYFYEKTQFKDCWEYYKFIFVRGIQCYEEARIICQILYQSI
jgi:hypothetical protein